MNYGNCSLKFKRISPKPFEDEHAVILNKQGRYFFIADESLYAKYVEEFGEECPECPIK
jgi:hypothetical protein